MSAVLDFLSRVERVSQSTDSRWRAICPCHASKSKSQTMSVRETSDGTVLIKCFAGCGALEIIKKVGMKPGDLFPKEYRAPMVQRGPARPNHWHARHEAMKTIMREVQLVGLISSDIAEGKRVSAQDAERCAEAVAKITQAIRACE
jgi:hypothetical protein